MSENIYYFTKGNDLRSFMRRGYIPRETIRFGNHVKSVIVCSTDPDWDHLEGGSILLYGEWKNLTWPEEISKHFGGVFRIELGEECAPLTWNDWVAQSGIKRKDARKLYKTAGADKRVRDKWRLSVEPIKRPAWKRIYQWAENTWTVWRGEPYEIQGSGLVLHDVFGK